jgi:hypothetical protein
MLPPPAKEELRRYQVRIQTHSGRVLPRRVVTYYGEAKGVALACEQIHRQLGVNDRSVTAYRVFVDDLGVVGHVGGLADIQEGDIHDRTEF